MFEGRITFSGALHNYIYDRDGDAGLKVELQDDILALTARGWCCAGQTVCNHRWLFRTGWRRVSGRDGSQFHRH